MKTTTAGSRLVLITTVPVTFCFFDGQIAHMKARGFDVHAISSPGDALARFAEHEQIDCQGVEMRRSISPLSDVVALFRMVRLLRRMGASIVHSHTPKGGLLGMLAARFAGVPVRIYHIHGMPYMTAVGWRRRLLRWTEKSACRQAHQVLCVSRSVRDVAVREGICPENRIKVLLSGGVNGVDARGRFDPGRVQPEQRRETRAAFGIPAEATVIGFVGRLVRDKGLVELAEAWRILRDEFAALHLLIVGASERRDPVPGDVIAFLRSDSRVHLSGESRNTPPLYSAMDLVCLPTHREGLGVVSLEAAAMGLPVVATQVPGCIDAIEDGVTGTLVPAHDPATLAWAIRIYLNDVTLRRRHGAAGRERVLREFRPELMWRAQEAEYLRLLQQAGLPQPRVAFDAASF